MNGERRQHVVEKADAGADVVLPAAVEIKLNMYICLRSLPVNGRFSFCHNALFKNEICKCEFYHAVLIGVSIGNKFWRIV